MGTLSARQYRRRKRAVPYPKRVEKKVRQPLAHLKEHKEAYQLPPGCKSGSHTNW